MLWVFGDLGRIVWQVVAGGVSLTAEAVVWHKAAEAGVVAIAFGWHCRDRRADGLPKLLAILAGGASAASWFALADRVPWHWWTLTPLALAVLLAAGNGRGLIRNLLRAVFALGYVAAAGAGLLLGSGYCWYPIPAPPPSAATDRVERWQQDLDYFGSEIVRLHANAFHSQSRERFAERLAELRAGVARCSDMQVEIGIAELAASIGDAHTLAPPWGRDHYRRLPVAFDWFTDGIFITYVPGDRTDLAGRKLIGLDQTPVAAACERLRAVISHENEGWFRRKCVDLLANAGLLQAVGVVADATRVTLQLEASDGSREAVTLTTRSPADGLALTRVVDGSARIVSQQGHYWSAELEADDALYFRYASCRWSWQLADDAERIFAALDRSRSKRLIVDLRGNSGGTSLPFHWFVIPGIQARPALNTRDRLFVLIDRGTFSSGSGIATTLRTDTNATLVGEPTGGRPNAYGEVRWFRLPGSGIKVHYSTKRHVRIAGADPRAVEPDHVIRPTHAQYRAQQDPALDFALAR